MSTATGTQSIQIGFTEPRISAYAGLDLMSDFLHRIGWRKELAAALPHARRSPHAFAPVDVALGFMAGVWCGADKFSRVGASGRRSAFARGARHRGAAEPADLDPLFPRLQASAATPRAADA